MRKLFLIPIVGLLILAGCGGGQKEPQAASLPTGESSANLSAGTSAAASPSPSGSPSANTGGSPSSSQSVPGQTGGIIPDEIAIPDIGVDTNVIQLGLTKTGAMAVPSSVDDVGWFKLGYRPGVSGHAVIAGHVDSNSGPAVFYKLKNLKKGNKIIVRSRDGQERVFRVLDKRSYPYKDAPLKEIFGPSDKPLLNLITCTGVFVKSTGMYQQRLVVTAELDTKQAS